ncbi:aspartate aminotransferase family protein [Prochlorococcus sp. MIT 1223]|uniref:aspartate aminotransferase family protein n=1 Tax=Prochlorococcus sp. MIT 1223 TaxID=3096217 RepID=UPI002A74B891|nr:aspartate aminotransferase family protein [Prochlorococcus sp. MIT 1223]
MGTYTRYPLRITKGKGCWVWDQNNQKYLDAVAGIATCSLGHSNRAIASALTKQLKKLQHISNLYSIPEQEELGQWLVQNSCADSIFFCNSGAEANEAAIKLARKYGHTKLGIKEPIILSAEESFHGRTLAAVSATGQPKYHSGFEPVVEGFKFFKYNNWESFIKLFAELEERSSDVVAVLIEPIQGEGGVRPGDKTFFKHLKSFCKEKKILLIFDEVQSGMGRTGYLWGYQSLEIEPDIFTLAKGLGGGHAIGALLAKKSADIFTPGDHASTFGGNPFACRAGLTVAKEIQKRNILNNVKQRGDELKKGLSRIKQQFPNQIQEIRGLGLMQGLVIKEDLLLTSQEVISAAIEKKLLLVPAGSKVVRMVPPLIIKKQEIYELVKRLQEAFKVLV